MKRGWRSHGERSIGWICGMIATYGRRLQLRTQHATPAHTACCHVGSHSANKDHFDADSHHSDREQHCIREHAPRSRHQHGGTISACTQRRRRRRRRRRRAPALAAGGAGPRQRGWRRASRTCLLQPPSCKPASCAAPPRRQGIPTPHGPRRATWWARRQQQRQRDDGAGPGSPKTHAEGPAGPHAKPATLYPTRPPPGPPYSRRLARAGASRPSRPRRLRPRH